MTTHAETCDRWSEPVTAEQLRGILEHNPHFETISEALVEVLAHSSERVFVAAGAEVVNRGSIPKVAFIVEHGRVRCDWGLERPMLGDLGRGEIFALESLIARQPMLGNAFALRDTSLIRIPAAPMMAAVAEYPELLTAFSRWIGDVALRSHGLGRALSVPNAYAVQPLSDDPAIMTAKTMLCEAFQRFVGAAVVVDGTRVRQILDAAEGSDVDFEKVPASILDWCGAQEADGKSLIFDAGPTEDAWSRWCMRQTDKIVIITRADADVDLAALDRRFASRILGNEPVRVSLVLVHDTDTKVPNDTARWLELRCLRRHHHVRVGNMRDFDRVARRLGERAVGVVLGGGGARGFAHIGVLQALEEARIHIDHVGGTSIGSIIAAAYARGWSPAQILEIVARVFTRSRAVVDLDIPTVAMLGGAKLDNILRELFGNLDIGDLWLPFYAISSSLTSARMVVHDRGPVWVAVRASASLPGVYPPVLADGQLLVDGGVVNNVPIDVMQQRCGEGTVIAVDVSGGGLTDIELDRDLLKGWDLLRKRLNPFGEKVRAPGIGQILVGSTMLSSKQLLGHLLETGQVSLYLRPPVEDFQLLGFKAYQRLYEIGYETARKALEKWDGLSAARGRPLG